MSHPSYLKLKNTFETLFQKYIKDSQFRDSMDTYLLEVKGKLQSPKILLGMTKGVSESINQLADEPELLAFQPGSKEQQSLSQKYVESISHEELKKAYLNLEKRHDHQRKELRKAKDEAKTYKTVVEGGDLPMGTMSRPNPKKGTWKCTNGGCGQKNNFTNKEWVTVRDCRRCGGPITENSPRPPPRKRQKAGKTAPQPPYSNNGSPRLLGSNQADTTSLFGSETPSTPSVTDRVLTPFGRSQLDAPSLPISQQPLGQQLSGYVSQGWPSNAEVIGSAWQPSAASTLGLGSFSGSYGNPPNQYVFDPASAYPQNMGVNDSFDEGSYDPQNWDASLQFPELDRQAMSIDPLLLEYDQNRQLQQASEQREPEE
jgi:hypothetical protein